MRVWILLAGCLLPLMQPGDGFAQNVASAPLSALQCETSSLKITFDARQPGVSDLSVDSLRRGNFGTSPIIDAGTPPIQYAVSQHRGWLRYALASDPGRARWEMRCDGNRMRMRSIYREKQAAQAITWSFDPDMTHATLLGHLTPAGDVALPAVLHLPGMGSLRVYVSGDSSTALRYDAHRNPKGIVTVTFPAATAEHKILEYELITAAIYPAIPGLVKNDKRFDGFRRDYLDIFQMQAELHVLANHAASDPCALVLYKYSDMARYTPELVKGLTALDLVRETLDSYLAGFVSYGMPGYRMFEDTGSAKTNPIEHYPYPTLDTYPSLLISAYDYTDGSGDLRWLRKNYQGLRRWAELMTAANEDGSPLLEYPISGNSGSWTAILTVLPSNWWDTIGFGHQDAYSNALGYRALRSMAALADRVGEAADAEKYRKRAMKIRDAYVGAFLDPSVGVLAGWRSADGQLHNYYFAFVNGIAVRYGLLDEKLSRQVMDRILLKMESVGYTNFALGLPGNLVPITRADYVEPDPRFGAPLREDGNDGFQIYENGGATACHAYFTISAFYRLGETEKGDRILMPMLESFSRQGFSGRAPNGLTFDWKDWQGRAHGYEGLLVDNYYVLLAVLDRSHMLKEIP